MKDKLRLYIRKQINETYSKEMTDADWSVYEMLSIVKGEVLSSFSEALDKHRQTDNEYMQERQLWTTIPYSTFERMWSQFIKFGEVPSQLWKYLDKIEAIITRNILKIDVNTEFAGHKNDGMDYDIIEDYGVSMEDLEKHFGDYIEDSNGAARISDFALEPLLNKLRELKHLETPEDRLMKIDQILEIIHMRSDIASWFVKGGSKALSNLSGYERNDEETKEIQLRIYNLREKLEKYKNEIHTDTYWEFRKPLVAMSKVIDDDPDTHNITKTDIKKTEEDFEDMIKELKRRQEFKKQIAEAIRKINYL